MTGWASGATATNCHHHLQQASSTAERWSGPVMVFHCHMPPTAAQQETQILVLLARHMLTMLVANLCSNQAQPRQHLHIWGIWLVEANADIPCNVHRRSASCVIHHSLPGSQSADLVEKVCQCDLSDVCWQAPHIHPPGVAAELQGLGVICDCCMACRRVISAMRAISAAICSLVRAVRGGPIIATAVAGPASAPAPAAVPRMPALYPAAPKLTPASTPTSTPAPAAASAVVAPAASRLRVQLQLPRAAAPGCGSCCCLCGHLPCQ